MLMQRERELVVEYGKKLIASNLTKGTGGNISMVNRERGYFAISPSGMDYFSIFPEDIVIMDLQANIIDGARKPSTEFEMHRILYEKRPDISAVIHAHTEYATVLACMRWDLPAVHYLIALAGKDVKCAQYATFGTPEVARKALEAMEGRYACLLANHGMIAGGKDLADTFYKVEQIEYCCQIYCRAKALGDPVILSDEEMEKHLLLFKTYGNADAAKSKKE